MKSNSICIVGGGSSGWMTAATLIKFFPQKKITLIESPNIPTSGVGESTLAQIKVWIRALGIDEDDFIKSTDASFKFGIKFNNFYKKDSGGFHYPFGGPFMHQKSFLGLNDWLLKKHYYPETSIEDYCRTFYPAMALIENNKISKNENGIFGEFNFQKDVAYHFDAVKFAIWLKDKYSIPRGVNYIRSEVKEVILDSSGVKELILDDGTNFTSDLYIDCTGFKSLLIGKTLKEPFVSYEDLIPNNRAWAVKIPYVDKEKELETYTNCTAIENGWVWNTPLWNSIGTGYVYSDKFVTKEKALEQFKNHLRTNTTVPNIDRITEELNYRDISMRIGIHERSWVKNVIAIGLSSGFIEPLESNGLITIHEFLFILVKFLGRDRIIQWDRDCYNQAIRKFFHGFAQFISLHYSLSIRDDTEYWKYVTDRTFLNEIIQNVDNFSNQFFEFAHRKSVLQEMSTWGGMHCISTGMEYFVVDESVIEKWKFFHPQNDYKKIIDSLIIDWDRSKKIWNDEAKKCPTHYQYLKENFYG